MERKKLLESFIDAKRFHLGKGMHDYISEQDLNSTFNGLRNPNELESFCEYLIERHPSVLAEAREESKTKGYIQTPRYVIQDDLFYTDPNYIEQYIQL